MLCFSDWALTITLAERIIGGRMWDAWDSLLAKHVRSFAIHEAHGATSMDSSKL
jgi:hypothetical protein